MFWCFSFTVDAIYCCITLRNSNQKGCAIALATTSGTLNYLLRAAPFFAHIP